MDPGEGLRAGGAVRVPLQHQPELLAAPARRLGRRSRRDNRSALLRTDHYPFCWGCSLGGEGLEFDWTLEGDTLTATYVVAERFQGPPGMAHGGVVAGLLDEACGQVVGPALSPAVTARLEVRYLAPVPVEEPLKISAQVVDLDERRGIAEATIQDASGLVVAHARAECVRVRPEHFLQTERGRARGLDWLPTGE